MAGKAATYLAKKSPPSRGAEMNSELIKRSTIKIFRVVVVLVVVVTGCASVKVRSPVPEELSDKAQIKGIPRARIWGDKLPPYADEWLKFTEAEIKTQFPALLRSLHNYLAISGGGANGAFGAGLLVGWTAAGNRPEFDIVTGISTGALMAPLAFLGPSYDSLLKSFYTTYSTKDLIRRRWLLEIPFSDAATDTDPLEELIEKKYDRKMLDAIAVEFRKGRRLFIGTTNLDVGRPVIWNIGYIATSGDPKALELFHKILLASASIPGVFPPVYVEVEAEGRTYDEMHVDGGTTSQVFLFPAQIDWRTILKKLEIKSMPKVYVIRNSHLESEWVYVKPNLIPIAGRSITSLIRTQGIGDMHRIYSKAQRHGLEYNLAFIPDEFDVDPKEPFDLEYMGKLFDLGYRMAKSGYPWHKGPPGFETR